MSSISLLQCSCHLILKIDIYRKLPDLVREYVGKMVNTMEIRLSDPNTYYTINILNFAQALNSILSCQRLIIQHLTVKHPWVFHFALFKPLRICGD